MRYNTKPAFTHDCTACIFLGQTIGGKHIVDLYAHPHDQSEATLIARYSSDGPDYASTRVSMAHPEGHAELWAAAHLYLNRGKKEAMEAIA